MQVDLVLLSLGGVQRFIGESRSTADVAGASEIIQRLARPAARTAHNRLDGSPEPCGLIFPVAPDAPSITNKIAFLVAGGTGPEIARAVAVEVGRDWRAQLEQTFDTTDPPDTPGMPDLAWVSVTGPVLDGAYGELWEAAQREMVGRRRARVFAPVEIPQRKLSAQSPGLPAVTAPRGSPPHELDEALSAAGWAKRRAGSQRFPSTVSIASSKFRSRLLERAGADPDVAAELLAPVRKLTTALDQLRVHTDRSKLPVSTPAGLEPLAGRLGAWATPERWDVAGLTREYGITPDEQVVDDGRKAAGALAAVARKAGIPASSPYFAVVVQDLDQLGRALGRLDLDRQREVSEQLNALARQQKELLDTQHPLAVLVYAGGDDLLAFCPAAAALPLAAAIRGHIRTATTAGPLATACPDGAAVTASTAVVYAHMSNPLQDALQSAQDAIAAAKHAPSAGGRSRDVLAVVVRRRGGERARTVQPWWPPGTEDGASATELLARIRPGPDADVLSAGLGSDLERDEARLRELDGEPALLRAELSRLVKRHGGTPEAGKALYTLGRHERAVAESGIAPVPAALVARFLSQEAR